LLDRLTIYTRPRPYAILRRAKPPFLPGARNSVVAGNPKL